MRALLIPSAGGARPRGRAWAALLPLLMAACDADADADAFLMARPRPGVPPSADVVARNGQDRPRARRGRPGDGFAPLLDRGAGGRRAEMRELQRLRGDAGPCGGGADWRATWTAHPGTYRHWHANNATEYAARHLTTKDTVRRYSCDADHPTHYDGEGLRVHFERYGPFQGTGNGDWNIFMNYQFGGLYNTDSDPLSEEQKQRLMMREQCQAHNVTYIRGSFVSIVDGDGGFLRYPPLHMHHLHVHPYPDNQGNRDHIYPKRNHGTPPNYDIGIVGGGSAFMDHHLIAQSHGDSMCQAMDLEDVDDVSCLLHLFPPGTGMRVRGSHGFRLDFEVNDVRVPRSANAGGDAAPAPLEPLEFYVEVALLWTPRPLLPATYLHFSAPESGGGPATYAVPLDESSSMIYFNYTHDWRDDGRLPAWDPQDERLAAGVRGVQGLGAGTVSNIVGHAHMTIFDSLFIFKESNESRRVFEAIDTIRPKDQYLPYIPECHGDTLENTKDRVTRLALQQGGGELVCEVTKPGLVWMQTPSGDGEDDDNGSAAATPSYAYRDRLMDFNCREEIRLEPGDTLTVVSFTKSRPSSPAGPIHRGSLAHRAAGVFEHGKFAQSEHTILRLDFVSDNVRSNGGAENAVEMDSLYAPPCMYLTQRWVRGAPDEAAWNAIRGRQWFSYVNKNIRGWNNSYNRFSFDKSDLVCSDRLNSMMVQCPASISMNGTEPEKNKWQKEFKEKKEEISSYSSES